jgi:hypothetical protein
VIPLLRIPRDDRLTAELWNGLIEVADAIPHDWTLVGAQMVFLHGLEHGRTPPRRTTDLDLVVDVRASAGGPHPFAQGLASLGYALEGVSADNVGHRFVRGSVRIDVLLPDGLGARTPRQVASGARSVEVPGGTQALRRRCASQCGRTPGRESCPARPSSGPSSSRRERWRLTTSPTLSGRISRSYSR